VSESKKQFPNSGILSKIPTDKQMYGNTHRGSVTVACPCGCEVLTDYWLNGKAQTGQFGPFVTFKLTVKDKQAIKPARQPMVAPAADNIDDVF
jgi:hypothetical protein